MNSLILAGSPQTMSSRELADLTEKRHDNVMRTIANLLRDGVVTSPQLEEVSNTGAGPSIIAQYRINKRDSYVIVAQLSPQFTARLVDRWQELESNAAPRVPQTMAQALRLAAEQAETIERQAIELAAAAPAVEFVDRYVDSTGNKGFRQVCKLLGANENHFREFLIDEKIMYRLGGEWVPHAAHLDSGRFVVKAGTSEVSGHAFNSAKFTPKGVAWVAGLWTAYRLAKGF